MSIPGLSDGLKKYLEFHGFKHSKIPVNESVEIPDHMFLAGDMVYTFYASNKWERKRNLYGHRHGHWLLGAPSLFLASGKNPTKVPGAFKVGVIVKLGDLCGPNKVPDDIDDLERQMENEEFYASGTGRGIGMIYRDMQNHLTYIKTDRPYPELYCTPDGKCLLVVEEKKKILAMIWGGKLNVLSKGIVG